MHDLLVSRNQCKDLSKRKGLKVKINANSEEAVIENVYNFDCYDEKEALKYFHKGLSNKVVASHSLNQVSSRSHSILTFIVEQEDLTRGEIPTIVSKLRLVDLAGSERQ